MMGEGSLGEGVNLRPVSPLLTKEWVGGGFHTVSNGLLITFEGVEGAGKTTQIELLRALLAANGFSVCVTREPGGEPVAEAIRQVLLDARNPVVPVAELLLFLASRAQMVERVLEPHLAAGEIVLCDRFTDSSVVYQGHARGLDVEMIRSLNSFATANTVPTCTILLDVSAELGIARQMDRNRMEAESLAFHERVREGYLAEARRDPERICVIDASRTAEEIHQDIVAVVAVVAAEASVMPVLRSLAKEAP